VVADVDHERRALGEHRLGVDDELLVDALERSLRAVDLEGLDLEVGARRAVPEVEVERIEVDGGRRLDGHVTAELAVVVGEVEVVPRDVVAAVAELREVGVTGARGSGDGGVLGCRGGGGCAGGARGGDGGRCGDVGEDASVVGARDCAQQSRDADRRDPDEGAARHEGRGSGPRTQ
jgi:hypothetical protein